MANNPKRRLKVRNSAVRHKFLQEYHVLVMLWCQVKAQLDLSVPHRHDFTG